MYEQHYLLLPMLGTSLPVPLLSSPESPVLAHGYQLEAILSGRPPPRQVTFDSVTSLITQAHLQVRSPPPEPSVSDESTYCFQEKLYKMITCDNRTFPSYSRIIHNFHFLTYTFLFSEMFTESKYCFHNKKI